MKYSCFNAASGLYRVFEDAAQVPINGDLPVPSLGAEVNGIGVPSIDAARPLPRGARYVQDSWAPVGVIVACSSASPFAGFGSFSIPTSSTSWLVLLSAAVAGAIVAAKVLK